MHHEASIVIDRPIDEVFALTTDRVAEWSIVVVEDEVIEKMPGEVGTTFRTVTEDKGHRMEFMGIVTDHNPPHTHAVHLTGAIFDIQTEYKFEDLRSRTKVTQFAVVSGKGFFKLILPLTSWLMKKAHCEATDRELASLKQFCEQQPVPANA